MTGGILGGGIAEKIDQSFMPQKSFVPSNQRIDGFLQDNLLKQRDDLRKIGKTKAIIVPKPNQREPFNVPDSFTAKSIPIDTERNNLTSSSRRHSI